MYQIMIVDDEPILRNGIKNFIDWKTLDCNVCCVAENGEDALRQFSGHKIDIVITDIKMPGIDGLELARRLAECSPKTKVIILTGYSDFSYAQRAIKYSVVDFVVKNNPAPKIREAVKKTILLIEKERQDTQFLGELEEIVNQSYDELKIKLFIDIINRNIQDPKLIRQKADHLGLSLPDYRLAIIRIPDSPQETDFQQVRQSVLDFSLSSLHAYQPFAFTLSARTLCIMLFPVSGLDTNESLSNACRQICTTLLDLTGYSVRIGISSIHEDILTLYTAYGEASTVQRMQNRAGVQFLYENKDADRPDNPVVCQILAYIHAHYMEDITLCQIADAIHLNASYLSRFFKRHRSETVVSYITRYRIERSKELLLHSDARLYSIAIDVGFNDAAYFSNIFKKYTGYSPSEYKSKFSE